MTRLALVVLVLLSGGCSWRFAQQSPERPSAAEVRGPRSPARVLVDDPDLASRLQAANAFERVTLYQGSPVAAADVDGVLDLRLEKARWDLINGGLQLARAIGTVFLVAIPFDFIYLDAATFDLSYSLTARGLDGAELARRDVPTRVVVESQLGGHDAVRDRAANPAASPIGRRQAALLAAEATIREDPFRTQVAAASDPSRGAALLRLPLALSGELAKPPATTDLDAADPASPWHCELVVPREPSWVAARLEHVPSGSAFQARLAYVPLAGEQRVRRVPLATSGVDERALRRALAAGPGYLVQPTEVAGRPATWVVTTAWAPGSTSPRDVVVVVELHEGAPEGTPRDVVALGPPVQEGKTPASCAQSSDGLVPVRVVFAQGRPTKVETSGELPFEAFLVAREGSVARGRSRNGALLEAKNRTLPTELRDRKTAELTTLATRVERACLDLAHEKGVAKDRAQALVEQGKATDDDGLKPDELRELALVYQERLEILKAVMGAIRAELENRSR